MASVGGLGQAADHFTNFRRRPSRRSSNPAWLLHFARFARTARDCMSRQCSCQKRAETNEVHNARPQEYVRGHRLLRFVRLDLGFAQAGSTLPGPRDRISRAARNRAKLRPTRDRPWVAFGCT